MSSPASVILTLATWAHDRAAIASVRRRVFIEEQGVSEEEEWDASDSDCVHVLAFTAKRDVVGTARLDDTGKIGRVAVIREWRGKGVGARLVEALIEHARQKGFERVHLNAQVTALDFYRRLGFDPDGPVFDEAGIPHRRMERATGHERRA
jgi:predicted GNAT family N-acyltransferase